MPASLLCDDRLIFVDLLCIESGQQELKGVETLLAAATPDQSHDRQPLLPRPGGMLAASAGAVKADSASRRQHRSRQQVS